MNEIAGWVATGRRALRVARQQWPARERAVGTALGLAALVGSAFVAPAPFGVARLFDHPGPPQLVQRGRPPRGFGMFGHHMWDRDALRVRKEREAEDRAARARGQSGVTVPPAPPAPPAQPAQPVPPASPAPPEPAPAAPAPPAVPNP
jgi:hypothetical protein